MKIGEIGCTWSCLCKCRSHFIRKIFKTEIEDFNSQWSRCVTLDNRGPLAGSAKLYLPSYSRIRKVTVSGTHELCDAAWIPNNAVSFVLSDLMSLSEHFVEVILSSTGAPWYVPNTVLRQDLQITSLKEEIHRLSTQYRDRLHTHPNNLTVHLTVPPDRRRLRRHLPTRFNV
jgi:hypothetical protein